MPYDNTNSGALFKNNKKETDKQPDYKGELNVNGDEFRIAAWLKTSNKGFKYMSLSVTPKNDEARQQSSGEEAQAAPDSDIPF